MYILHFTSYPPLILGFNYSQRPLEAPGARPMHLRRLTEARAHALLSLQRLQTVVRPPLCLSVQSARAVVSW